MIPSIASMSEEQIDLAVADIIASLDGTTERDFVRASEQYNSLFFKGMPSAFKKRVCSALVQHFLANTNNYWINQSQLEFV